MLETTTRPRRVALAARARAPRKVTIILSLCLVGLVSLLISASAQADGNLYLERFFEPRNGVGAAQLFVYSQTGEQILSGRGSGGYEAGELVGVPEGWYWVEVGRFRTEYNLQRFYVRDGQTTVVPSGWVSVQTTPLDEQTTGCDQWNAELTAFRVDETGQEHLVSSNQGTGVSNFGMLQLPVGEYLVYFHQFPSRVTIRDGQDYRLATGFQSPVAGDRPQIALWPAGTPNNIVLGLCSAGPLHLPAGEYWVSRIIPTDTYPFEDRVWDRVIIPIDQGGEYSAVRAERVRNRYQGEGSQPEFIDSGESEVLANYRRRRSFGGGGSGFEGLLP
ncbi:MAG: hypothetical protein JW797_14495 [Bradymonadales bacterium]|nr:hypothetical protein [Bradymonadales bacterium]